MFGSSSLVEDELESEFKENKKEFLVSDVSLGALDSFESVNEDSSSITTSEDLISSFVAGFETYGCNEMDALFG